MTTACGTSVDRQDLLAVCVAQAPPPDETRTSPHGVNWFRSLRLMGCRGAPHGQGPVHGAMHITVFKKQWFRRVVSNTFHAADVAFQVGPMGRSGGAAG